MDTIEIDGLTFVVDMVPDIDAGAPWDNQECLGDVSHWERRDKAPGERVLSGSRSDHGGQRRFYDFAGAVRRARSEGMTGKDAAEAADREYHYLRAWCRDDWYYMGVIVTLLDVEGNKTDISDSVWCVESDGDYSRVIADELASGLHTQYGHLDELTTVTRIRKAA
jgi:hypothetical protein